MELRIRELCDQRGIKSAYELAKKTGYDHKKEKQEEGALNMPTAYRAFANDIKQFTLETLKALCGALDCSPNDIFGVQSINKMPVNAPESPVARSESESRQSARSGESKTIDELPALDDENDKWLSTKEAAEYVSRDERTVRDFYKQGLPRFKTGKGSFVKYSDLTAFWMNRK